MEQDSLISHGASGMLKERLMEVSDAYKIVYCATCGMIAIMDVAHKKVTCRNCNEKNHCGKENFVQITVPYVYKLLVQLLWGAGWNMKLGLKRTEEVVSVAQ